MNVLELKAKIYQYTGVFLAEKEFGDFLRSYICKTTFHEMVKTHKSIDYVFGMIEHQWRHDHGFIQCHSEFKYNKELKYRLLHTLIAAVKQYDIDTGKE